MHRIARLLSIFFSGIHVFGSLCFPLSPPPRRAVRLHCRPRSSATARTSCAEGSRWCLWAFETSHTWRRSRITAPSARTSICIRHMRLRVSPVLIVVLASRCSRCTSRCTSPGLRLALRMHFALRFALGFALCVTAPPPILPPSSPPLIPSSLAHDKHIMEL